MAKIALLQRNKDSDITDAGGPAPVAPPAAPSDPGRAGRIGLWALALGFGGFIAWAAVAPLDEGVAAPAQVSIDTKRKTVQHLSGGIVKEVLAREGQKVKEGDVLIRLDEAAARASFENTRQRYMSLRAMEARLVAEQTGAKALVLHPDLAANLQDPLIKAQVQTQEQLLNSRRNALAADVQSFTEQSQGQEQSIKAFQSMIDNRKSQVAMLSEELKNTRDLANEGYAPRNRLFELERMIADVNSAMADALGNTVRARASIADLRQRIISRQQDYRKEVETQLADVSAQVLSEAEKFRALRDDLARTEIKAPASGQVVGMQVQSAGGVIGSGQKLMDIVPSDEPLLLEARIAPNFIDRVHAGLPVDIRFNSFSHTPTLVVDGKVTTVSSDLVSDTSTNPPQSYYLARVTLTPEGYKKLGNRQMQAGMPSEVVIRTGERSLLKYMMAPVVKRMAASMKEE